MTVTPTPSIEKNNIEESMNIEKLDILDHSASNYVEGDNSEDEVPPSSDSSDTPASIVIEEKYENLQCSLNTELRRSTISVGKRNSFASMLAKHGIHYDSTSSHRLSRSSADQGESNSTSMNLSPNNEVNFTNSTISVIRSEDFNQSCWLKLKKKLKKLPFLLTMMVVIPVIVSIYAIVVKLSRIIRKTDDAEINDGSNIP